ncbi:MAG: diaminopimelate epimerase [Clostridium sp.]|nr:diaminopimelate epimerase [Clostridium sp.]
MSFTKMHGAGNDYIYIDTTRFPIDNPEELSIRWSAPHTGIGSDGLVLIGHSDVADFSMRIFNADGSEALMCGNASRCIGKYVYDNKMTTKKVLTLETLSGIKTLQLHLHAEQVDSVTVDMGCPQLCNPCQLDSEDGGMLSGVVETEARSYVGTFVCMGNPHFVVFVDDINSIDLPKEGRLLEYHTLFPERANIEFVQPLPDGSLRMRVWERGSGITQACGTGACATAVAAVLNHVSTRETIIRMDGGVLTIRWDENDGHVYMTGPAVTVFKGEIPV